MEWNVSGAGESVPAEVCVIFPGEAYYEESAANRQSNDRSVPADDAECSSVRSVSSATLHVHL